MGQDAVPSGHHVAPLEPESIFTLGPSHTGVWTTLQDGRLAGMFGCRKSPTYVDGPCSPLRNYEWAVRMLTPI